VRPCNRRQPPPAASSEARPNVNTSPVKVISPRTTNREDWLLAEILAKNGKEVSVVFVRSAVDKSSFEFDSMWMGVESTHSDPAGNVWVPVVGRLLHQLGREVERGRLEEARRRRRKAAMVDNMYQSRNVGKVGGRIKCLKGLLKRGTRSAGNRTVVQGY
jgi:hypothetical protein